VKIRPLTPADTAVVKSMFVYTICWRDDVAVRSLQELLTEPAIGHYIAGWPRLGDEGVIATETSGEVVGAAWYRVFDDADHGFGYISSEIPELGIAVVPEHRGHGVGSSLMTDLITLAAASGHPALSLSVELDNARAIRVYEKLGFVRVGLVGGAWTMLRRIDPSLSARGRASGRTG
jgi:ribosomal protein S18 acetylase RimI-like enzyme